MNRRKFLQAIAAVPVVGALVAKAAEAAPTDAPLTWEYVDPMSVAPVYEGERLVDVGRVTPADYGAWAVNPYFNALDDARGGIFSKDDLQIITPSSAVIHPMWKPAGGGRRRLQK